MGVNMIVYQIVNEFKRLNEVVAITLAGSCASGRKDDYSDIDINIITSREISIDERETIVKRFADIIEINNTAWGTSDEFILRNSDIQVDIAYFDFEWIKSRLEDTVDKKIASLGYTTCFWHNVINSYIVYDKESKFNQLKEKYDVPYPKELKSNIINKNYYALKKSFSAYYNQIEKAIKRKDLVNLNNKVSNFLDSYFDIIFAINELPHPGEKRLLNIMRVKCKKVPESFSDNIENLIKNVYNCNSTTLNILGEIINKLDVLIEAEKN